jgi:hypothetical protein
LASLHASASSLPIRDRLPERGPSWYLEILREARLGLCQSLPERNWDDLDRSSVERMLVCFELLERNWHLIEDRCDLRTSSFDTLPLELRTCRWTGRRPAGEFPRRT